MDEFLPKNFGEDLSLAMCQLSEVTGISWLVVSPFVSKQHKSIFDLNMILSLLPSSFTCEYGGPTQDNPG